MLKVKYIDHMGSDLSVVNDARQSYGARSAVLSPKDERLINYLASHEHMTPFEGCELKVQIECPLPIRSQIMRHRVFSYNEISRRYTTKDLEFYEPETWRIQSEINKQASLNIAHEKNDKIIEAWGTVTEQLHDIYKALIDAGVCKEQARYFLPQGTMTTFGMKGSLRNWVHFVKLRDHPDAQWEAQEIARQVKDILFERFPVASEALFETAEKA